jgi:dihydropteroate synthase
MRTILMGVVNVTPDSFSDGGRYVEPGAALKRARELAAEGADIIDVGGESSRPGSLPVGLEEELSRTIPVVEAIARALPGQAVSIDTTKAHVARLALAAGAAVINDISALRFDPDMAEVAAASGARVVLMHLRGSPRDMQVAPTYRDVVGEIYDFLAQRVEYALSRGIPRARLIIDPGLGFGKSVAHNLEIIRGLRRFRELGCPLLAGPSRKNFLGALTGAPPGERDGVTAACVALLVAAGADMVRVHNVRLAREAALLAEALA